MGDTNRPRRRSLPVGAESNFVRTGRRGRRPLPVSAYLRLPPWGRLYAGGQFGSRTVLSISLRLLHVPNKKDTLSRERLHKEEGST